MITNRYLLIKKYNELLPNFIKYYNIVRSHKHYKMFYLNTDQDKEEIIQIVSICILETKNFYECIRMLYREVYYYVTRIKGKAMVSYYKLNNKSYPEREKIKIDCPICKKTKYSIKRKLNDQIVCSACYEAEFRRKRKLEKNK